MARYPRAAIFPVHLLLWLPVVSGCLAVFPARADPVVLEERGARASASVTIPESLRAEPALFEEVAAAEKRAMAAFLREAEKAYEAFGGDRQYWLDWELTKTYEERFIGDAFLSFLGNAHVYTGGAHGNTVFDVVNFDRRQGRRLALADFFGPLTTQSPVLKAIADHARKDILRQQGTDADEDWVAEGTKPEPGTYEIFTLVPSGDPGRIGGLAFHFPPYQVGPYVWGYFHVVMPWSAFADYLRPEWRDLFGGTPQSHR